MQQIDSDRALEECLPRLPGQSDVGSSLADPEQVRVTNVVAFAIGHHQAERLERLLPHGVAQFFGAIGKDLLWFGFQYTAVSVSSNTAVAEDRNQEGS